MKNSAGIYDSSGSQFFRTTTGIQLGPDAFDKSRFFMTFKNHLMRYRNIIQFQISPKGKKQVKGYLSQD